MNLNVELSDQAIAEIAQRVAVILARDVPIDREVGRWLTVDQAAEHIAANRQRISTLRGRGGAMAAMHCFERSTELTLLEERRLTPVALLPPSSCWPAAPACLAHPYENVQESVLV